ncbi:hypothetical protein ACCS96_06510, partial [Rhizobium ruizarguesonis]
RRFLERGSASMQNGTRNRYNLPTSRPTPRPRRCGGPEHHGVSTTPQRERFSYEPIICAKMKENQQILNDEFSYLDSMVKSPDLGHTKIDRLCLSLKRSASPFEEIRQYNLTTYACPPLT